MTTTPSAVEFTVVGGEVPADELLELLAKILLDLEDENE